MHYSVSPHLEQLIDAKLTSGEYASAEELFADALGALDKRKARHAELRASVQARLANAGKGLSQPLDVEEFLADARRAYAGPVGRQP